MKTKEIFLEWRNDKKIKKYAYKTKQKFQINKQIKYKGQRNWKATTNQIKAKQKTRLYFKKWIRIRQGYYKRNDWKIEITK